MRAARRGGEGACLHGQSWRVEGRASWNLPLLYCGASYLLYAIPRARRTVSYDSVHATWAAARGPCPARTRVSGGAPSTWHPVRASTCCSRPGRGQGGVGREGAPSLGPGTQSTFVHLRGVGMSEPPCAMPRRVQVQVPIACHRGRTHSGRFRSTAHPHAYGPSGTRSVSPPVPARAWLKGAGRFLRTAYLFVYDPFGTRWAPALAPAPAGMWRHGAGTWQVAGCGAQPTPHPGTRFTQV